MQLKEIKIPGRYNYIACFLTLDCNLKCDYCINLSYGMRRSGRRHISGKEWIRCLNRLSSSLDLPVTLQGGEPGLHPDFIQIINGIKKELNIDILTNLSFDIDKFISGVDPGRLKRGAPYPNIRVSYHPEEMRLGVLVKKVLRLQSAGFSTGIFSVLYPKVRKKVLEAKKFCLGQGIDFRTKEFLGIFKGKIYGHYFYPEAVYGQGKKRCLCRTSELIIDPHADVFRCHHDLYYGMAPVGNLLDPSFRIRDTFRSCASFGDCNPCDVKIKTNRFQIPGHHSVEIKNISR